MNGQQVIALGIVGGTDYSQRTNRATLQSGTFALGASRHAHLDRRRSSPQREHHARDQNRRSHCRGEQPETPAPSTGVAQAVFDSQRPEIGTRRFSGSRHRQKSGRCVVPAASFQELAGAMRSAWRSLAREILLGIILDHVGWRVFGNRKLFIHPPVLLPLPTPVPLPSGALQVHNLTRKRGTISGPPVSKPMRKMPDRKRGPAGLDARNRGMSPGR